MLVVALALALGSSFRHIPDWHCIDIDVLGILFSLMLVVSGLKSIRFLDWLALELLNHCTGSRTVSYMLVAICFIASMFVTNDVALITFVPLALIIGKTIARDMVLPIILMTMAANLGGMLTPQGNPQNLFLFNHYGYTAWEFIKVMSVPVLLSGAFIFLIIARTGNAPIVLSLNQLPRPNRHLTLTYLVLLTINIAAVLHYFDKWLVIGLTTLIVAAGNRLLLKQVDYSLLLTFIGFFIFIGNVQDTELVAYLKNSILGTVTGAYVTSALLSQIISNVPAAMLLAGLTDQADPLLVGVNVGGLGTLIASMASVISYKLFAAAHPYQAFSYLKSFIFYNFLGLIIIGGLSYLWLLY